MTKVGPLSLELAIILMIRDKGTLTKQQVFDYLKKIEITNAEFVKAWKFGMDWGYIRYAKPLDEEGKVWTFEVRNDYGSFDYMDRYAPQVWDVLLDEGKFTTTLNIKVECRYRDEDKILNAIKQIPIVINAEEVEYDID